MSKPNNKGSSESLYKAILMLESVDECRRFFDDLCTITELTSMEQRFNVAYCLHKGMVYSKILEEAGASSATISRVNRSLQNGAGGYGIIFDRLDESEE